MDLQVSIRVWGDELWYLSSQRWVRVPQPDVIPWLTQQLLVHPQFKGATRQQRQSICQELLIQHKEPDWHLMLNGGAASVIPLANKEVYCPTTQSVRAQSHQDHLTYGTDITWPEQLPASVTNTMNAFAASPEDLLSLRKEMLRILSLTPHAQRTTSLWVGSGNNGRSTILTVLQQLFGDRISKGSPTAATVVMWYRNKDAWQSDPNRANYHCIVEVSPSQAETWQMEDGTVVVNFGIVFSPEGAPKVDSDSMRSWITTHTSDILAWLVGPRPRDNN